MMMWSSAEHLYTHHHAFQLYMIWDTPYSSRSIQFFSDGVVQTEKIVKIMATKPFTVCYL
jgi:hypothetical protein